MKKIMIAAAVAAIGYGAFGATACSPCSTGSNACAPSPQSWVYKWQFKGKTTTGKKAKAVVTGSVCNPQKQDASCTIRVPASLKIQGYTWTCSTELCAKDDVGNLAFESAFTECSEVFWQTKPYKASFYGGVTIEFAHLIGKKKNKVEVLGLASLTDDEEGATYDLVFAGFGKVKSKLVKKVSGNFAGSLSQPWVVKKSKSKCSACSACNTESSCVRAGYWDCETLTLICKGPSIAYGKWSAKYMKSASSKYFKDGTGVKTPKWVIYRNLENCQ